MTSGPAMGMLLIHGGGDLDKDDVLKSRFLALAGGRNAEIVVIPTAKEDSELPPLLPTVSEGTIFGVPATILHTRNPEVADSPDFVQHLKSATAVFIEGGRQPRLADAYLNTQTHRELENLLGRGGLIAGSSAGATILGSFMVRNQGPPDYEPKVMVDNQFTTEGFAFLKNMAIDQHITARGREDDLTEVVGIRPELLGVGIDEYTAIIVQGNIIEVIGKNRVFIHDGKSPRFTLETGQNYNLMSRKVLQ